MELPEPSNEILKEFWEKVKLFTAECDPTNEGTHVWKSNLGGSVLSLHCVSYWGRNLRVDDVQMYPTPLFA